MVQNFMQISSKKKNWTPCYPKRALCPVDFVRLRLIPAWLFWGGSSGLKRLMGILFFTRTIKNTHIIIVKPLPQSLHERKKKKTSNLWWKKQYFPFSVKTVGPQAWEFLRSSLQLWQSCNDTWHETTALPRPSHWSLLLHFETNTVVLDRHSSSVIILKFPTHLMNRLVVRGRWL